MLHHRMCITVHFMDVDFCILYLPYKRRKPNILISRFRYWGTQNYRWSKPLKIIHGFIWKEMRAQQSPINCKSNFMTFRLRSSLDLIEICTVSYNVAGNINNFPWTSSILTYRILKLILYRFYWQTIWKSPLNSHIETHVHSVCFETNLITLL
jgi:hypothetical protein